MKNFFSMLLLLLSVFAVKASPAAEGKEIYEIKIYHFRTSAQEKLLDEYLANAFLPALHKSGISNTGAFKPLANDTAVDKIIYVFIPFTSLEQWHKQAAMPPKTTAAYEPGADYINAVYTTPPYIRMESVLVEAFPLAPRMQKPVLKGPHADRIYELRSYESPTEQYNASKVKMFNTGGEIALFKRLGFNAIFYGEVLSGSHMPNLMYMTSFENKQARDEHWKAFGEDAEWKTLKALPEYQNNVSKAEVILCHAAPYSEL